MFDGVTEEAALNGVAGEAVTVVVKSIASAVDSPTIPPPHVMFNLLSLFSFLFFLHLDPLTPRWSTSFCSCPCKKCVVFEFVHGLVGYVCCLAECLTEV